MQKKGSLQEMIGDLSNTLCSFNVEKPLPKKPESKKLIRKWENKNGSYKKRDSERKYEW